MCKNKFLIIQFLQKTKCSIFSSMFHNYLQRRAVLFCMTGSSLSADIKDTENNQYFTQPGPRQWQSLRSRIFYKHLEYHHLVIQLFSYLVTTRVLDRPGYTRTSNRNDTSHIHLLWDQIHPSKPNRGSSHQIK